MREILAFDIGGTSVRAGLYCPVKRSLLSVVRTPAPNHKILMQASCTEIFAHLFDMIARLGAEILQGNTPNIIVLSFPGPIDLQGNVLASPTIVGDRWEEPVNLGVALKAIWPSAKIYILNDVTAAGYRYLKHERDDLCITTVSSGIGSKIFVKGSVLVGSNGWGGEIGHIRVDPSANAPICECGGIGHLGALASGRATTYQAHRLFENDPKAFASSGLGRYVSGDISRIDNELVVQFNQRDDPWTRLLVQRMVQPLAQIFSTLHLAIGIERFVIIGGFALALGENYRRDIIDASSACTWNLSGDWNEMIELGFADDDSGLIGAGYYGSVHGNGEQ